MLGISGKEINNNLNNNLNGNIITDINNNNNSTKSNISNSTNNTNNSVNTNNNVMSNIKQSSSYKSCTCAQNCVSYIGSVNGNRKITEKHGNLYACLSIPTKQIVSYSFPMILSENILSSLPPTDASVCVENVQFIVRTAIISNISQKNPKNQNNGNEKNETTDITVTDSLVGSSSTENHDNNNTDNIRINNTDNNNLDDSLSNENNLNERLDQLYLIDSDVSSNKKENFTKNENLIKNESEVQNSLNNTQLFREIILEISPLSTEFREALQERMGVKKDEKDKDNKDKVISSSTGRFIFINFLFFLFSCLSHVFFIFNFCCFPSFIFY